MTAGAYALSMSEIQLQTAIIGLAKQLGYLVYHTHDSRKSPEGFPDLVLVHKLTGRLIIVELKDAKRKPTQAQLEWLGALHRTKVAPYVGLWRPEHWRSGAIEAVLKGAVT
jgi:hypothetical protein